MAGWSALSGGARAAVVASGAAVVVGVTSLLWPDAPAPEPAAVAALPAAEAPAEPAAAPSLPEPAAKAAQNAPAEPAPAVAAVPDPVPPIFDNSRVDSLGNAVVAGRADPGAAIAVLVDAVEVAQTTATADGSFAALFTLPPNDKPSLMTLEATLPDGRKVASVQSVAIAPIARGPDQVAIAEPPAALLVTEEGVSVVQAPPVAEADAVVAAEPVAEAEAPATAPVAAVLIDAISYAPDGAVQVSGKGQGGQTVRVYVDNAAVAEAAISPNGVWSTTLGDTAPGIYTLRVDQVDSAGAVTARFETPFKREAIEALAALSTPDPAPAPEATAPAAPEAVAEAAPEPAQDAAPAPVPSAPEAVAEATPEPAQDVAPEPAAEAVADASTPSGPAPEAAAEPVAEALATPEPPADPEPPEPPQVAAAEPIADVAAPAAPAEPAAAPAQAEAIVTPVAPVTITVQPGFTLWRIARDSFGDGVMYVQVYEANRDKIRDPDLIYPGQVFTLPGQN